MSSVPLSTKPELLPKPSVTNNSNPVKPNISLLSKPEASPRIVSDKSPGKDEKVKFEMPDLGALIENDAAKFVLFLRVMKSRERACAPTTLARMVIYARFQEETMEATKIQEKLAVRFSFHCMVSFRKKHSWRPASTTGTFQGDTTSSTTVTPLVTRTNFHHYAANHSYLENCTYLYTEKRRFGDLREVMSTVTLAPVRKDRKSETLRLEEAVSSSDSRLRCERRGLK
ncbi:hypothetical protein DM860_018244 [Cuscuta australis]|uniref:Uncharacterized protein n=1 Tax=Cuscuta australis TaxID=267555 RepID=A0A328DLV2_9ASTE|nr:hypothetical protein DM860_018244 [Cuscuta australis]